MTNSKHTILFITHEDDKYGAAKSFMAIVENLDRNKYNPILVSCKWNAYNKECDKIGIKNYIIPYVRCTTKDDTPGWKCFIKTLRMLWYNYIALSKLRSISKKESVELIHTNTSVIDIGMRLSMALNIPHIWHFREFLDADFSQKFLKQDQIKKINDSGSYVIYISHAVEKHWKNKGIKCPSEVIYNGVEIPPEVSKIRDVGSGNGKLAIVFSSHITPNKGQDQLVEALHLMDSNEIQDLYVHFFGTGDKDYLDYLKHKITSYGLNEVVFFKGFANNLKSLLPYYDIGMVCSKAEGFGRVTVEYMLSKLCVIASDTGANIEIVEDGKTGLLYKYEDAQNLADKIRTLINDRELLNILSENGSVLARKCFNEDKYISACHRVYERQIDEN